MKQGMEQAGLLQPVVMFLLVTDLAKLIMREITIPALELILAQH
jgi:hypothetical protein